MGKYKTNYTIPVRLSDIDSAWHVNNAKFLSFIEHARHLYFRELGVFDGKDFKSLPVIVGDIHCRYIHPIEIEDTVVVSLGVTRISNKTITLEYELTGETGTPLFATAESIMVAYDYRAKQAVRVSDELRQRFGDYEGIDFSTGTA